MRHLFLIKITIFREKKKQQKLTLVVETQIGKRGNLEAMQTGIFWKKNFIQTFTMMTLFYYDSAKSTNHRIDHNNHSNNHLP